MASIQLREPKYNELPQIASLLANAFWNDEIFGDLMHPRRAQYPRDYELWFLQRLRKSFWNARSQLLVALATEDGHGTQVMAGVAQWNRVGPGGKALGSKAFSLGKLYEPIMTVSAKIQVLTRPNRASDPSTINVLQQTVPFTRHMWSGDRAEALHLEMLAVHPKHQGKGIGKMLVRRVLEQAERQGIWASVTASRGKDGFYQSCGYEMQDGHVGMGGRGNPLADCQGGNMWWKRPPQRR